MSIDPPEIHCAQCSARGQPGVFLRHEKKFYCSEACQSKGPWDPPLRVIEPPVLGEIVFYVLPDGPRAGERRPALVVRQGEFADEVRLHVFVDRPHDGARWMGKTSVIVTARYASKHEPGTWGRDP